MKLMFIRHADPDYSIDSLTEKGWKEAELLANRMIKLDVKEFYCSPLGRAKDTANVTLKKVKRKAVILDWLQEFYIMVKDPTEGYDRIPWDFMPGYWTKKQELYDKNDWINSDVMQTGSVRERYREVTSNVDSLLETYGYQRDGGFYRTKKGNTDTIVFFCHLGSEFVILSHLLGMSATVFWQHFFVAPTSITLLETEERVKGEACFRCKRLGDVSHLYAAGEEPSNSGFFQEIFH